MPSAIVDTGPLVAWFDRSEPHHEWAVRTMETLGPPLLVCEPVLTEAAHLLRRNPNAQDSLLAAVESGALSLAFVAAEHIASLRALRRKYRDTPMSLADACIVRMAELHDRHAVFTLDSDFTIYRKHGKSPLALIRPD